MEPFTTDMFRDAVATGGGTLQPLDESTKGLLWVSPSGADALQDILDRYPGIEWIQLPWAGVDAFAPVLASIARQPGSQRPVVTSAKGAYSEPVAEHALALLLGTMRELPRKARDAHWQTERTGISLFGRHIVLLGAGGVARAFLDLVAPFRPQVTVVRRSPGAVPGATRTVTADQLHDVLPEADAVVVAAAATHRTAQVIGAKELRLMPDHAVVVNIARGSLVDADAVLEAVSAGRIFGAGLDVMDPEPFPDDHPIWAEKRIVITSHSADTPPMTAPLLARRISTNVAAYGAGKPLVGVVDVEAGY
jgi:phosphoglycerate dehydrogenase-like enzyme